VATLRIQLEEVMKILRSLFFSEIINAPTLFKLDVDVLKRPGAQKKPPHVPFRRF
jgi:hypothetical protein